MYQNFNDGRPSGRDDKIHDVDVLIVVDITIAAVMGLWIFLILRKKKVKEPKGE